MNSLAIQTAYLSAMTPAAIARVQALQASEAALPQVTLDTQHVLHAGLYARTVSLPAGVEMTGALIKVPTLVIVEGDVLVWLGHDSRRFVGYHVLAGSAGRKQAFYALADTMITMVFPTDAKTVEDAERQFTDEFSVLASRRADARNTIMTGE